MLTDGELYSTLNTNAAKVWKTNNANDFVVARRKEEASYLNSFFNTEPADILLVIRKGSIMLFDETLLTQIGEAGKHNFDKISINGCVKYVKGDLSGLIKKIKQYHPQAEFPVTVY